jgi:hypothetical protein
MNAYSLTKNAEHCLKEASKATGLDRMRFIRAAEAWRSLARSKLAAERALLPDDEPVTTTTQSEVA